MLCGSSDASLFHKLRISINLKNLLEIENSMYLQLMIFFQYPFSKTCGCLLQWCRSVWIYASSCFIAVDANATNLLLLGSDYTYYISIEVKMRCNACWRELEDRAVSTTCGHLLCILVQIIIMPYSSMLSGLLLHWHIVPWRSKQVLKMQARSLIVMHHVQSVIKCFLRGQYFMEMLSLWNGCCACAL